MPTNRAVRDKSFPVIWHVHPKSFEHVVICTAWRLFRLF